MTDSNHIDMTALAELKEVMEDEFPVLINTYLTDSVLRIAAIKEALGKNDPEELRRAAHSFKGSCGNIGALPLSELCKDLEQKGRDGNLDGTQALFEQICAEYEHVKASMEKMVV